MQLEQIDKEVRKYAELMRDHCMILVEMHSKDPIDSEREAYDYGYLRELERWCKNVAYLHSNIVELMGRAKQRTDNFCDKTEESVDKPTLH